MVRMDREVILESGTDQFIDKMSIEDVEDSQVSVIVSSFDLSEDF